MNKNSILEKVNEKIKSNLEDGEIPWKRPWVLGLPKNYISKKPYNGFNFIVLATNNYPTPDYISFLQCKKLGEQVLKGEKGHMIIFWKIIEVKNNDDKEIATIPIMRYHKVFNVSQTTLWDAKKPNIEVKITKCTDIYKNLPIGYIYRVNTMAAYYDPVLDFVSYPPLKYFDSEEEWRATGFHELIHWTGHKERLNRNMEGHFGDHSYSLEELIAEMGTAYLCGLCGISQKVISNSSAYIKGWLKKADKEVDLFTNAASEARKAVDYILNEKDKDA